jgi:Domain of unknown function (DUF4157)
MERHQRIQLKTTSRSTNQPFQVSPFQTRGFGLQQKAASTPASKAELWENYQRSSQIVQQGAGQTRSAIQAKLTIGQPGDKYEQEADSVADRVMAMSEPAQVQREELGEEEEELQMKPLAGMISPLVQREELPEEEEELQMKPEDHLVQREELPEEEEELQMKSLDNSIQREELPEEEEEIQMKEAATSSTPAATTSLEDRLSSSKGGGSPLSDDVRSFMEPRFGADFSGVRVHTGSDAVQMNQDVSAQAFAHGSDVYFGAGKAPGKDALTAHELTHVVQQTGGVQRDLIQRDDKEDDKNNLVDFDHELECPIELKDNKGQTVFTQAAELTLSLNTQALYTAKSSKFKFSFGKLKLATVVSAASEMDGGVASTNTEAAVSLGASVTILSAKITSTNLFLPEGSKLKLDGVLSGTFNSDGSFESKMKPKLVLGIPISMSTYFEAAAKPGEISVGLSGTF